MTIRILVVHGDAADLAVIASVAAAHAFELEILQPTDDLVAETKRIQPDAIILDVKQRVGDGYALCSDVKRDPVAAKVPVILTGSNDGMEAQRRAFAAGCDDFLEKPIDRRLLAYRLRSYARLQRAWAERLEE